MKNDWQHIALYALALAGAALCVWKPQAAQYVGPLLGGGVIAGVLKGSPLGGAP